MIGRLQDRLQVDAQAMRGHAAVAPLPSPWRVVPAASPPRMDSGASAATQVLAERCAPGLLLQPPVHPKRIRV
jgi:hypothetical protein